MSSVSTKKHDAPAAHAHHRPPASHGNILPGSAGRLSGIDFSSNDFTGQSIGSAAGTFQRDIRGQQFSFVKATQGTHYQNPYFGSEWKILGKKVQSGQMALRVAYHFLDPGTYSDGVAQAHAFLKKVGVHGKLPGGTKLALDWEMAAASTPQVLKGAADTLHKVTGQWPIVYTNAGNMGEAHRTVPAAPKWEADYGPSFRGIANQGGKILPSRSDTFDQYSDGTGYRRPYDLNVYNGSLASLRKFAGSPGHAHHPAHDPVTGLDHNPYFERQRATSHNLKLDSDTAAAAATTHPDGKTGIGAGMHGDAVKNVQARLLAAGYDPEGVNGHWDLRTETALKDFQSKSHLPVTGRVDSATWAKLDKAFLYARGSTSPAQSLGEHDGAVRTTQNLLRRDGYSAVAANGLYDRRTERAVAAFQRKEHLRATGDVNGKTLSDLKHFSHGPSVDRSKIYLQQPTGWSCAPTSLTMAEAAWGVAKPNDGTVFRLAKDMGDGPGTGLPGNASLIAAQARRNGLKASYNSSTQASAVRQALKEGKTCVVNGSLGVGGHFIYIGGLDSHGRFIVFDPFRPQIHTWSDADLNAFTHVGTNPPGFAEIWK